MSKPDQNLPKVLGVVYNRPPPDQIGIPLPPGLILRRVSYPIGRSSRIIPSGLQGRQRWQGLGRGGHWDQAFGTGRLIRWTSMEEGIRVNEW